jgi:DNA invertase Pin-like site-specific DNA recombinase
LALFRARGAGLRSLQEGIDTTTPGRRLVFHVFSALAQFERAVIIERSRTGVAAARARGRVGGRPALMTPAKLVTAKRLREGRELGVVEPRSRCSCSATFARMAKTSEARSGLQMRRSGNHGLGWL